MIPVGRTHFILECPRSGPTVPSAAVVAEGRVNDVLRLLGVKRTLALVSSSRGRGCCGQPAPSASTPVPRRHDEWDRVGLGGHRHTENVYAAGKPVRRPAPDANP